MGGCNAFKKMIPGVQQPSMTAEDRVVAVEQEGIFPPRNIDAIIGERSGGVEIKNKDQSGPAESQDLIFVVIAQQGQILVRKESKGFGQVEHAAIESGQILIF